MLMGLLISGSAAKRVTSKPSATVKDWRSFSGSGAASGSALGFCAKAEEVIRSDASSDVVNRVVMMVGSSVVLLWHGRLARAFQNSTGEAPVPQEENSLLVALEGVFDGLGFFELGDLGFLLLDEGGEHGHLARVAALFVLAAVEEVHVVLGAVLVEEKDVFLLDERAELLVGVGAEVGLEPDAAGQGRRVRF